MMFISLSWDLIYDRFFVGLTIKTPYDKSDDKRIVRGVDKTFLSVYN